VKRLAKIHHPNIPKREDMFLQMTLSGMYGNETPKYLRAIVKHLKRPESTDSPGRDHIGRETQPQNRGRRREFHTVDRRRAIDWYGLMAWLTTEFGRCSVTWSFSIMRSSSDDIPALLNSLTLGRRCDFAEGLRVSRSLQATCLAETSRPPDLQSIFI